VRLDVLHHANHHHRLANKLECTSGRIFDTQLFADGILAGPNLFGHRIIDDCNVRVDRVVSVLKFPARQQRRANGSKISRECRPVVRHHRVLLLHGRAFGPIVAVPVPQPFIQREMGNAANRLRATHCGKICSQLLEKTSHGLDGAIARPGKRQLKR